MKLTLLVSLLNNNNEDSTEHILLSFAQGRSPAFAEALYL